MTRPRKNIPSCIWAFTVLLLLATTFPARADLLIMPLRIVFQDRERTADVTLVNTSSTEATFRLSWMYQRQKEDGSYTQMEEGVKPDYDFSKMVIFSPRQVTLPPNGKQRVRLSLRRPPNLPDGEYHAHLRLQRLGASDDELSSAPLEKGRIRTSLAINIGYGLPVVFRQGNYNGDASISDPSFVPVPPGALKGAKLKVQLNRRGVHGTMGRLVAYWSPPDGEEKQIGVLNNVNVYTEVTRRTAMIPLTETYIPAGTVRVVYEGDGPDEGITFDEQSFPIGG